MAFLLQDLLKDSARRDPNKDAVISGEATVSYRELDDVTDKLAAVLRDNGVKKGDRVGILIDKSIPSILAIHGALKAGAVYVPLDPHTPPARLAYIIRNCGIRVLLSTPKRLDTVSGILSDSNPLVVSDGSPLDVVVLTEGSEEPLAGPPTPGLPIRVVPWADTTSWARPYPSQSPCIETDLAYILYTSGSTGVPKGVMISHLNAFTFVNWAQETFHVSDDDRLANHAPLHFDLSIFDIFVTMKAGATLVLVPEGISTFPIRLADFIEKYEISVWYSVPTVLSMMTLHGKLERHSFSKLRAVLFAGEVFPVKYLRQLMEHVPHAEYFNLYGPTETNVIAYLKVEPIEPDQIQPVPIGKACANIDIFALSDEGRLVTRPGEEGELYARGSCVAQGYWGDVEKTAQVFLTNHTQSHFQETMYKTGDIVTLDEEGNYIFMGRRDHMIKSRGYRIELGEIEAVLYSHPAVKEAAVLAHPDEVIGNRIRAYVVLSEASATNAGEIQGFCSQRLPHYMVPEAIEIRESLPRTSTDKVDKPALVASVGS